MSKCLCGRFHCPGCGEGDWIAGRHQAIVGGEKLLGGPGYDSGYNSICKKCRQSVEFCRCKYELKIDKD